MQMEIIGQLKKLKLERYRTAELQQLDLDLREKLTVKSEEAALLDLRRSFFLHQLRVLNIHFAKHHTVDEVQNEIVNILTGYGGFKVV